MNNIVLKRCNGCGKSKTFDCFSTVKPGRGDKNNLASRCKQCRSKRNLEWHYANPLKAKQNRSNYYLSHKDKEVLQAKNWREENPHRHAENNKRWKSFNPASNARRASAHRSARMNATPSWLSAIHHAQIQEMYDVALALSVQTGIPHHVDHIFPLQGETWSGLHVPWNLQVIPAFENISKKNGFPEHFKDLSWGAN